jgi:hypothetical protein
MKKQMLRSHLVIKTMDIVGRVVSFGCCRRVYVSIKEYPIGDLLPPWHLNLLDVERRPHLLDTFLSVFRALN